MITIILTILVTMILMPWIVAIYFRFRLEDSRVKRNVGRVLTLNNNWRQRKVIRELVCKEQKDARPHYLRLYGMRFSEIPKIVDAEKMPKGEPGYDQLTFFGTTFGFTLGVIHVTRSLNEELIRVNPDHKGNRRMALRMGWINA